MDYNNIQFIDCIIRTLNVTSDFGTIGGGNALFRRCDFKGKPINALQTQSFAIVILDTCFRVPDNLKTNTFNYQVQGSTTLDSVQNSINLAGNYYIDYRSTNLTPLLDRELTTEYYVDNEVATNTNNLSSVQTQVDSLIDIFSQGISFRAYSLSSATISSGQNLPFNNESNDSQGTYDTSTYVYTIDIAGTYLFTFGWYVVYGSTATINLFRKRSGTAVIIQQSANGTATGDNTSFYVATIAECQTGDEIYANLAS